MTAAAPRSASRLWDLLAAAPLIVWYLIGARGLVPKIIDDTHTPHGLLQLTSHVAALAVMAFTIVLFLVRRLPVAKLEDPLAKAVAILAANLNLALLALPAAELPPTLALASTVLSTGGLIGSIVVLAWLGRSFAILPQARALVTSGPYRIVRHPLYATELVSSIGIAMIFAQPWSVLITIAAFALQLRRMAYEERILTATFPDYAAYSARTARLIPGIY